MSEPRRTNWLQIAGGACVAFGFFASLVTHRLQYAAVLAGIAAMVVGARQGRQPARRDRHASRSPSGLGIAVAMSLAVGVAILAIRLMDRHDFGLSSHVALPYTPPPSMPAEHSGIFHEDCDGLTFSPKGLLATYGAKQVRVWQPRGGIKLVTFELEFKPERVTFVDGNALMALSSKGDVKRLQIDDEKIVDYSGSGPWKDQMGGVVPAVTPDGKNLVTGGDSPALWSLEDKKLVRRYEAAAGTCDTVAASSRHVAGNCGALLVWDIDASKVLAESDGAILTRLAISPKDTYVVTSTWTDYDGHPGMSEYSYDVYDLKTLSKLYSVKGQAWDDDGGDVAFKADAAFDAEERLLVMRTGRTEVTGIRPESGQRAWREAVEKWGYDLDLSPDGSRLALSAQEPQLIELDDYKKPSSKGPRERAVASTVKLDWAPPDRPMTTRERELLGTWIAKLGKGGSELPDFAGGKIFSMKGRKKDVLGMAQAVLDDKKIPTGCLWMKLEEGFKGRREPCALTDGIPNALVMSNPLTGKKIDKSVEFTWYLDGDTLKIHTNSDLVALRAGDAGTERLRFRHWYLTLKDHMLLESFPEFSYSALDWHGYIVKTKLD